MAKKKSLLKDFYQKISKLGDRIPAGNLEDYFSSLSKIAEIHARPYFREEDRNLEVGTAYWIFHLFEDFERDFPSNQEVLERVQTVGIYLMPYSGLEISLDDLSDKPQIKKRAKEIWNYNKDEEFQKLCLRFDIPGKINRDVGKLFFDIREGLQVDSDLLEIVVNFDEVRDKTLIEVGKKVIAL